jgi:hypothetical protein
MESRTAASPPTVFRKPPPPATPPPAPPRTPRPPADRRDRGPDAIPGGRRSPTFRGFGSTLFGLHVVNALFTLGTLGVYYF